MTTTCPSSMTRTFTTSLGTKMNIVISFTKDGELIGEKISQDLGYDHIINSKYEKDVRDVMADKWLDIENLIFVSSTGIAVRYIKDYIVSKDVDPAVIVIDDQGHNVISLLSGHLGGANDLAIRLAGFLGARPVISTATDNKDMEAVDVFAKRCGYLIEDIGDIKPISMAMLENKPLGFYSTEKDQIDYDHIRILEDPSQVQGLEGLIMVTNDLDLADFKIPSIVLRPKNLVIGIGSRRGKSRDQVLAAIKGELERLGKSIKSINHLASAQAKADEEGIIQAAKTLGVEFRIYEDDQIKAVQDKFTKSDFVHQTIGLYNVSESAAYLGSTSLLSQKQVYDGITISVGEI